MPFSICYSHQPQLIFRSGRANDEELSSKKSKSHHKKKDHKKKHKHEHKSKSSKHRDDAGGEKRKHKKRKHENGNVRGEKHERQNVSYLDDGPASKHMKLDENSLQVGLCSVHAWTYIPLYRIVVLLNTYRFN